MLTAKGDTTQKVKGFELGTDDYLVKPFEPAELVARVKALLKRYRIAISQTVQVGELMMNRKTYEVFMANQSIELPLKEFELLFKLASYPGKTFSREQLIEDIWGYDYEGTDRTVDVHINRLRERFPDNYGSFKISTIRGLGYRLEVDGEKSTAYRNGDLRCYLSLSLCGRSHILELHYSISNWDLHTSDFSRGLITLFAMIFLFLLTMWIFSRFASPRRMDFFTMMIDAMRRISKGDYNVKLANQFEHKKNHPFGKIVESINEMAVELNQIEQMRQEFISNVHMKFNRHLPPLMVLPMY